MPRQELDECMVAVDALRDQGLSALKMCEPGWSDAVELVLHDFALLLRSALEQHHVAVARAERADTELASWRESLDLATGPASPLPPMVRDVVRGFFTGVDRG